MFNRKKSFSQNRAVFTLVLKHNVTEDYFERDDYKNSEKRQRAYDNLAPNSEFAVKYRKLRERKDNNGMANYSDVRNFCEHIINDEIKNELQELVDLPIKEVKVNRTYEGSLIVVFSVLFNIYQLIGGISGFRDSILLIEKTVKRHMKKRINDEFYTNGYFDITVDAERDRDYGYMEEMFHYGFKKRGFYPMPVHEPNYKAKRDGMFWYLLVSNIVLLITVGILVWRAVINMYW